MPRKKKLPEEPKLVPNTFLGYLEQERYLGNILQSYFEIQIDSFTLRFYFNKVHKTRKELGRTIPNLVKGQYMSGIRLRFTTRLDDAYHVNPKLERILSGKTLKDIEDMREQYARAKEIEKARLDRIEQERLKILQEAEERAQMPPKFEIIEHTSVAPIGIAVKNEYLNCPECDEFASWTDWQDYVINHPSHLFSSANIIVKAISFLLAHYYHLKGLSYIMPHIGLGDLVIPYDTKVEDSQLGTRLFNAIQELKKSPYCQPRGTSSGKKFLEYEMNYINLSETRLRIMPLAIEHYFNLKGKSISIEDIKDSQWKNEKSEDFRPQIGRIITPTITLDQVVLDEKNLAEIRGYINSIKNRDKLLLWGVNYFPKLLLLGTIGTGKSICAQGIASELNLKLYRISSEDVVASYLGETARNIASVFEFAQKHASSLILFIDEIDSVLSSRNMGREGVDREMNRAINTFIQLMEEKYEILIIGATNHAHLLDKAALSRFTKKIWFNLPTPEMIAKILDLHLKKMPLANSINLKEWANCIFELKFSGRDIRNLIVEICQEMLTRNIDLVSDDLFGECIERVKKSLDFEEESKKYFEDVLSQ